MGEQGFNQIVVATNQADDRRWSPWVRNFAKDAEIEAAKDPAHRGRKREGGWPRSIHFSAERSVQTTADGRKFQKYTAGHAKEKADYYNMMSDLMNVSEQIWLAQGMAPTIEDFTHLPLQDAKDIISHVVPMLTKMGGDEVLSRQHAGTSPREPSRCYARN
jgi:hypothetical protein